MDNSFLITGATGGLGKAFCAACAQRGYNLFLTDISPALLDSLATGLQNEYGIEIHTFACNLADESGRDALYQEIEKVGMRFVGLANIAGTGIEGEFASLDLPSLRTIMQLNMFNTAENINRVLRYRQKGVKFIILNVASLAAFQPMPYKALYAATKRFLVQLSLGIREELKGNDVSVSVLCPSGMPTTPTTIKEIDVQGVWGRLTAMNTGDVAEYALSRALRGQAVIVPGTLNQIIKGLTKLVPETISASFVKRRWSRALLKRCGTLCPQEGLGV